MANNNQIALPSSTSLPSPSTTTHTFSIKLNSKNYLAWKAQFLLLLNYQKLMGFIDGTQPPPPKTIMNTPTPYAEIPNSTYESWFERD